MGAPVKFFPSATGYSLIPPGLLTHSTCPHVYHRINLDNLLETLSCFPALFTVFPKIYLVIRKINRGTDAATRTRGVEATSHDGDGGVSKTAEGGGGEGDRSQTSPAYWKVAATKGSTGDASVRESPTMRRSSTKGIVRRPDRERTRCRSRREGRNT